MATSFSLSRFARAFGSPSAQSTGRWLPTMPLMTLFDGRPPETPVVVDLGDQAGHAAETGSVTTAPFFITLTCGSTT